MSSIKTRFGKNRDTGDQSSSSQNVPVHDVNDDDDPPPNTDDEVSNQSVGLGDVSHSTAISDATSPGSILNAQQPVDPHSQSIISSISSADTSHQPGPNVNDPTQKQNQCRTGTSSFSGPDPIVTSAQMMPPPTLNMNAATTTVSASPSRIPTMAGNPMYGQFPPTTIRPPPVQPPDPIFSGQASSSSPSLPNLSQTGSQMGISSSATPSAQPTYASTVAQQTLPPVSTQPTPLMPWQPPSTAGVNGTTSASMNVNVTTSASKNVPGQRTQLGTTQGITANVTGQPTLSNYSVHPTMPSTNPMMIGSVQGTTANVTGQPTLSSYSVHPPTTNVNPMNLGGQSVNPMNPGGPNVNPMMTGSAQGTTANVTGQPTLSGHSVHPPMPNVNVTIQGSVQGTTANVTGQPTLSSYPVYPLNANQMNPGAPQAAPMMPQATVQSSSIVTGQPTLSNYSVQPTMPPPGVTNHPQMPMQGSSIVTGQPTLSNYPVPPTMSQMGQAATNVVQSSHTGSTTSAGYMPPITHPPPNVPPNTPPMVYGNPVHVGQSSQQTGPTTTAGWTYPTANPTSQAIPMPNHPQMAGPMPQTNIRQMPPPPNVAQAGPSTQPAPPMPTSQAPDAMMQMMANMMQQQQQVAMQQQQAMQAAQQQLVLTMMQQQREQMQDLIQAQADTSGSQVNPTPRITIVNPDNDKEKLPTFDGTKDFMDFKRRFINYFESDPDATADTKLRKLRQKLVGKAADWLTVEEDCNPGITYEELLAALVKRYQPQLNALEHLEHLKTIKAENGTLQFKDDLLAYYGKYIRHSDEVSLAIKQTSLKDAFILGLDPEIASRIGPTKFATLEQLAELAVDQERLHKNSGLLKTKPPERTKTENNKSEKDKKKEERTRPWCDYHKAYGHETDKCYERANEIIRQANAAVQYQQPMLAIPAAPPVQAQSTTQTSTAAATPRDSTKSKTTRTGRPFINYPPCKHCGKDNHPEDKCHTLPQNREARDAAREKAAARSSAKETNAVSIDPTPPDAPILLSSLPAHFDSLEVASPGEAEVSAVEVAADKNELGRPTDHRMWIPAWVSPYHRIIGLVDTGADRSVIGLEMFNKSLLREGCQLQPTECTGVSFTQQPVVAFVGQITKLVKIGPIEREITFLVSAKATNALILGLDAIKKFRITHKFIEQDDKDLDATIQVYAGGHAVETLHREPSSHPNTAMVCKFKSAADSTPKSPVKKAAGSTTSGLPNPEQGIPDPPNSDDGNLEINFCAVFSTLDPSHTYVPKIAVESNEISTQTGPSVKFKGHEADSDPEARNDVKTSPQGNQTKSGGTPSVTTSPKPERAPKSGGTPAETTSPKPERVVKSGGTPRPAPPTVSQMNAVKKRQEVLCLTRSTMSRSAVPLTSPIPAENWKRLQGSRPMRVSRSTSPMQRVKSGGTPSSAPPPADTSPSNNKPKTITIQINAITTTDSDSGTTNNSDAVFTRTDSLGMKHCQPEIVSLNDGKMRDVAENPNNRATRTTEYDPRQEVRKKQSPGQGIHPEMTCSGSSEWSQDMRRRQIAQLVAETHEQQLYFAEEANYDAPKRASVSDDDDKLPVLRRQQRILYPNPNKQRVDIDEVLRLRDEAEERVRNAQKQMNEERVRNAQKQMNEERVRNAQKQTSEAASTPQEVSQQWKAPEHRKRQAKQPPRRSDDEDTRSTKISPGVSKSQCDEPFPNWDKRLGEINSPKRSDNDTRSAQSSPGVIHSKDDKPLPNREKRTAESTVIQLKRQCLDHSDGSPMTKRRADEHGRSRRYEDVQLNSLQCAGLTLTVPVVTPNWNRRAAAAHHPPEGGQCTSLRRSSPGESSSGAERHSSSIMGLAGTCN